jgi:SAM-dependent methyltransferase
MHTSAYKNAERFFFNHCKNLNSNAYILDVGSYDFNGTLKPIFKDYKYVGVDMSSGPNVDFVCKNDNIPFKDNYFDVIISTSCFEHDDFFWLTFLEMCRLVKPNGFIYINAPSGGVYHAAPVDNWRFYIDSWKAMEKWGIKNSFKIKLLESYIDDNSNYNDTDMWKDSIGIYTKL